MHRYFLAQVVGVRSYSSFDATLDLGFGVLLQKRIHIRELEGDRMDYRMGTVAQARAFPTLVALLGGRKVLLSVDETQRARDVPATVYARITQSIAGVEACGMPPPFEGLWAKAADLHKIALSMPESKTVLRSLA